MAVDLGLIKTIVIVMMENRSFDNLLGYLSCTEPYNWTNVDGIKAPKAWKDQVANAYDGEKYSPFILTDPYNVIDADPLHERENIALQMGRPVDGKFPLDGFIANYMNSKGSRLPKICPSPVMGYFTQKEAPVTDFFARNFAICDHWFSSLPAGTQPNRLMAMSGYSKIDTNCHVLPEHDLVYDWLTEHGIKWRVYHECMPFFALMPQKWLDNILFDDEHFRPLTQLASDIKNIDSLDNFPQVIFVEPTYTDCPHIGVSTDDHSPTGISGGQEFLSRVYQDITTVDPDFWAGTVMIITYDEHGGFFDHVSPPAIRTVPPPDATYQNAFESLGVRVPAFIISPFVTPQHVHNEVLDHTSILKFIGERFGKGSYSEIVDKRPVGSVLDVLNRSNPPKESATAMCSLTDYEAKRPRHGGFIPGTIPDSPMQLSFQNALDNIRPKVDNIQSKEKKDKFTALTEQFPIQPRK